MKEALSRMFAAAIESARPDAVLRPYLAGVDGPVRLVGAGKAAIGMASVAADCLDVIDGAVVSVQNGIHLPDMGRIRLMYASHPLPGEASAAAATEMLRIARASAATPGGTLICLLSGGGSSLMSLPPAGVSLRAKAEAVRAMLEAGASIQDINCVRRHLSRIKGGRLALAAGASKVMTFAVSDVAGDNPADIASGPTVPDPTSRGDALEAITRSGAQVAPEVLRALLSQEAETPFPTDPAFPDGLFVIVASGDMALEAAAAVSGSRDVVNLGAAVTGDSAAVAASHAELVLRMKEAGRRCVILSGGETTTVLRGPGRGGSNTEFLLSLAGYLQGVPGVWALAADTDGIDGKGGHAGAWFGPDLTASGSLRDEAAAYLADSDSATFFERHGTILRTGPTGTNVNDFRAVIVE